MHIKELAGKKICILGYGREGKAMTEALGTHAVGCNVTIAEKNAAVSVPKNFAMQTGEEWLHDLERFDVMIKSPGIPPLPELAKYAKKITTSTQIFFDSMNETGAIVIGVTGSKGKSTTSSLIHAILIAAGKDSHLVGNIGEPAISHLKDAKMNTIFVHELSSYQLMDLTSSPTIAVVTAFFPEHLDYHGSLEAYLEAKKHITRFQNKNDTVIFNAESAEAKEIAAESTGTKIPFSVKDSPVTLDEIILKGTHNLGNIAAAWKVCKLLDVSDEISMQAIKTFKGLPHRLESLGVHSGIEWVNDSISTTPESAVAALEALGTRVSVLIVGGQDRGYDFTPLAKKIQESPSIRAVILLPDSGIVIGKAIEHVGAPVILSSADTLEEGVKTAMRDALDPKPEEGVIPIVLLSPAAPSYGHFKNFEDRGEQFRALVVKN